MQRGDKKVDQGLQEIGLAVTNQVLDNVIQYDRDRDKRQQLRWQGGIHLQK
jgi:hypothetical protein